LEFPVSKHREVAPRTNISRSWCSFTTPLVDHKVSRVYWLPSNQSQVKTLHLHVGYLGLFHSPQNPLAHPWVKHSGDGVPDTISLPVSFSRDHSPKTFQCASMHIHLFRGSFLKTK
jgi:hypothetical protein